MLIHLNFTDSPANAVSKTLSKAKTFDVTLRLPTNVLNPSILVKGILTDFVHYNYAYIPEFARYYFIKNIESMSNELVTIHLSVDVLMSFKDQIKNLTAVVMRSQTYNNSFLSDSQLPLYSYTHTVTKSFSKGFNPNPSYFIALKGVKE